MKQETDIFLLYFIYYRIQYKNFPSLMWGSALIVLEIYDSENEERRHKPLINHSIQIKKLSAHHSLLLRMSKSESS
jgi:hypothetical protein